MLVLKYGLDFQDYGEAMKKLLSQPEVKAASPFVYHEMLLAKDGFRTAGVLVKGIDVQRAPQRARHAALAAAGPGRPATDAGQPGRRSGSARRRTAGSGGFGRP